MTDIVAISLIGAVPATLAALASVVNTLILQQHGRQLRETGKKVDTLEVNTNGKMTELVDLTRKVALKEGGDQVRADVKLGEKGKP